MKSYRRRPLPAKLVLLAAGTMPLFAQFASEPQKQLPAPAVNFYQLLRAHGLEAQGDYHAAKMPPVNQGLLEGQLAWRQHDGGHTDAPNMKFFIQWAGKFISSTTK
jgi:hypothetical protein